MTTQEILSALEAESDVLPREALEAAAADRAEITPYLLDILRRVTANSADYTARNGYFGNTYALFLLAQFRETAAYPVIVDFCRLPEKELDDLLGDTITEDLHSILASVCGEDIGLIQGLIEDPAVHEYVRSAGLHALVTLVVAGILPRDLLMAYFKTLLAGKLEREPSAVWDGLANCVTDLHPGDVYEDLMDAYDDGLIDNWAVSVKEIDKVAKLDKDSYVQALPKSKAVFIENTVAELEHWYCFNKSEKPIDYRARLSAPQRESAERLLDQFIDQQTPPVTPIQQNEFPDVGRNDPCPCGSGKKFKKCCGRLDTPTAQPAPPKPV